ncbi:tubulin-tyrosine ligase [Fomitiporia mediterranea MF3/22]|uniref:tubulin-tyrosine ligase n=1 Tax=Fomitiporia mediterranea (strain MF3/22) TaxID=694068 RepID=UPI0004409ABD|nr:tubulin-tyrosine ligase [Fomitiporia mediterranea MF3/22]EJD03975.1 tubulin-tyrosine ligase [Fomitiporia mediterranea MF3/22]
MELEAFIKWPGAPLTEALVLRALNRLTLHPVPVSAPSSSDKPLLQWATYDCLDHDLTLSRPSLILSSSFTIRKALIRKHFLHRCILAYTTKYPESRLLQYVPRTWDIEISFADELDELWSDELWDLAEELDSGSEKWWILKPGMSDRGMGIRLFNSKDTLQRIFEEFEATEDEDDESGNENANDDTNVATSQLRHFVIQEYVSNPVLLDPRQSATNPGEALPSLRQLDEGRKFHLRAYCVASGALSVYLYPRILALFSSEAYVQPSSAFKTLNDIDLRPHLTNTCLQGKAGETNVRLLDELVGYRILSEDDPDDRECITEHDIASITNQVADALSETFKAALQMPVHFQPLPNAFELYGVDLLVSHGPSDGTSGRFQVKLLEFNSEPAIEMTGARLRWILEDLFDLIAKTCIHPFFSGGDMVVMASSNETEGGCALRQCLDVKLRG